MPRGHRTTARTILTLLLLGLLAGTANAAPPKQILFPVVGQTAFTDDFGAPRGSRSHQGNDLMAARGTPVVAVEAGVVRKHRTGWGGDCMLYLDGRSGTTYYYIHLNNDLTRRNDNRASDCRNGVAYAPGLRATQRVRAGQLIGYVGDSGNADGGSPHLHFELHPEGGGAVSPYRWLKAAPRLLYAVPTSVRRVRLALYGTVKTMDPILTVDVNRIAVSRGWRGTPAVRRIALSLAPDVVIERLTKAGEVGVAALPTAAAGERVSVWTSWFPPTLATQLAGGAVLAAERIRLRGLAP